jgi:hypothetical protein
MKIRFQPLDRLAIAFIVTLTLLIGFLLLNGDRSSPYIRDFSWANQQVNADNNAFILTFSRPMNQASVEQNLKLEPILKGKFSWSGRRMAYTLTDSVTYGQKYKLTLQDAYDGFSSELGKSTPIKTFSSSFSTPNPAFAYIGGAGNNSGRLIIYDLVKNSQQILTSGDLIVLDFKIYSDRSKILFAAVPKTSGFINPLEQKLYTINLNSGNLNSGKTSDLPRLVLDSGDYQNFKFDLSADGKAIVAQRLSRVNIGQYGLWVIRAGEEPKSIGNQPGGDFIVTPDSESVAIAQGEGVAILPLVEGGKPLDFLPKFGMVLSFSKDGSEAIMIKFNKDYTRSLFRVTNLGVQEEILNIKGSILSAQFDRKKQNIYGIFTDVMQTATTYQEQPYIGVINLKTSPTLRQVQKLQILPAWQRDVHLSLAPDAENKFLFDLSLKRSQNPFEHNSKIIYNNLSSEPSLKISSNIKDLTKFPCITSPCPAQFEAQFPEIIGSHPQWLP